jgi:hypothetical protein
MTYASSESDYAMSTPVYPRFAALADYQQRFLSLVTRGAEIDIRGYELASVARLLAELRPVTLKLLTEARSMLAALLVTCEGLERPSGVRSLPPPYEVSRANDGRFERTIDAAVALNRASVDALEEVAFVAQLELRQRAERLERLTLDCEAATLLAECDSALRRLRKSLHAVGLTIARVLGVPPLADYTSELQSSIAVRRALAGFRTRVTKGGEPAANKLRERLSYISNQIEILLSWDMYSGTRVRDRLLLRGLQQRLLTWLNTTKPAHDAGLRLWQDVAACVEMFTLVNRRQELLEHDSALLARCVATLGVQPEDAQVDETLWRDLQALTGLDLELDALLKAPAVQARALLPVLERLNAPFCKPAEPPQTEEAW